jgi:hypothetical protein
VAATELKSTATSISAIGNDSFKQLPVLVEWRFLLTSLSSFSVYIWKVGFPRTSIQPPDDFCQGADPLSTSSLCFKPAHRIPTLGSMLA